MKKHPLASWSVGRLRLVLLFFFLALAVPTISLIAYAYSQLKWEAFHTERGLAEELVKRIDRRFKEIIAIENARPFTDYSFFNVAADNSNQVKRSPLSQFSEKSILKGTIGYFQIDPDGRLSTPLLPSNVTISPKVSDLKSYGLNSFGLSREQLQQRYARSSEIMRVLSSNQLIESRQLMTKSDVSSDVIGRQQDVKAGSGQLALKNESQAGFEKLQSTKGARQEQRLKQSLGRLDELQLSKQYEQAPRARKSRKAEKQKMKKFLRKEQNILPKNVLQKNQGLLDSDRAAQAGTLAVNMFESEIDAMDFSVLDSGHWVLFRKVWKNGKRLIQGIVYEPAMFIDTIIRPLYYEAKVSFSSDLTIAYEGNILSVLSSQSAPSSWSGPSQLKGFLLLDGRLAEPFSGMNMVFSANQVPAGPGGVVVNWLAFVLVVVLCGGFVIMYRLGLRQITLARQQQDFISAVSHELKTPLTSIRMYGEMLMQGWAGEEKRQQYYGYIYDESERLTRLINNVLQMARMTRNELQLDIAPYKADQLMDTIASKVSSQIERAGFSLCLNCAADCAEMTIEVDLDYFVQIIINLVDNAVKFSAKEELKKIDIDCRLKAGKIEFSVRDYGPGIPNNQIKKIFDLFYRSQSELTRETLGTGIGLALVTELTQSMHGSIDVVNRSPGAEFQLMFPLS